MALLATQQEATPTKSLPVTIKPSGAVKIGTDTYIGNAVVPGTGGMTANQYNSYVRQQALKAGTLKPENYGRTQFSGTFTEQQQQVIQSNQGNVTTDKLGQGISTPSTTTTKPQISPLPSGLRYDQLGQLQSYNPVQAALTENLKYGKPIYKLSDVNYKETFFPNQNQTKSQEILKANNQTTFQQYAQQQGERGINSLSNKFLSYLPQSRGKEFIQTRLPVPLDFTGQAKFVFFSPNLLTEQETLARVIESKQVTPIQDIDFKSIVQKSERVLKPRAKALEVTSKQTSKSGGVTIAGISRGTTKLISPEFDISGNYNIGLTGVKISKDVSKYKLYENVAVSQKLGESNLKIVKVDPLIASEPPITFNIPLEATGQQSAALTRNIYEGTVKKAAIRNIYDKYPIDVINLKFPRNYVTIDLNRNNVLGVFKKNEAENLFEFMGTSLKTQEINTNTGIKRLIDVNDLNIKGEVKFYNPKEIVYFGDLPKSINGVPVILKESEPKMTFDEVYPSNPNNINRIQRYKPSNTPKNLLTNNDELVLQQSIKEELNQQIQNQVQEQVINQLSGFTEVAQQEIVKQATRSLEQQGIKQSGINAIIQTQRELTRIEPSIYAGTGLYERTEGLSDVSIKNNSASKSNTSLLQNQNSLLNTILKQDLVQIPSSRTKPDTIQIQNIDQLQQQQQKQQQIQISALEFENPSPKPSPNIDIIEMLSPRALLGLGKSKKKSRPSRFGSSYSVLVRKQRKFVPVASNLSRGQAYSFGQRAVINSLDRSFAVVENPNRKIKQETFGDEFFREDLFRPPVKNGKVQYGSPIRIQKNAILTNIEKDLLKSARRKIR